MTQIVYLNGSFCAASEAKLSIFDRSIQFADSIYEVIPVYDGRLFRFSKHLKRLESSLSKVIMALPELDWLALFNKLIEANGGGDMQIYLQITRGSILGVRKLEIPSNIEPTVIAYTLNTPYPSLEAQKKGLRVELVEDLRWLRCDIKATALLANVLLNDEAQAKGADTAIFVRDGFLIEGSASNLFLVDKKGRILTSPLNNFCLSGVTRLVVIELINSLSWTLCEEKIPKEAIFDAQEVWITSTTKEIFPVTQVNEIIIGNGKAGSYWSTINEKYKQLIKNTYD
ncbi:MAG: aminotransferase class IV [Tatlockia sp.]|nr:aminotransferase class IV [Tatlockia sp.]